MSPQEALDYLRDRLPEITATPTDARPRWSARDVEAVTTLAGLRLAPATATIRRIPRGLTAAQVEALVDMAERGSAYLHGSTRRCLTQRGLIDAARTRTWESSLTAAGYRVVDEIRGNA